MTAKTYEPNEDPQENAQSYIAILLRMTLSEIFVDSFALVWGEMVVVLSVIKKHPLQT